MNVMATVPSAPPFDVEKRVSQFIALRDKIEEIKEQHKKELAPYYKAQEALNIALLTHLQNTNSQNATSKSGTVYRKERVSVTIKDQAVFRAYVIETGEWDLVDWRANKVTIADVVDQHAKECAAAAQQGSPPPNGGGLPPGLNFTREYVAGVQRK